MVGDSSHTFLLISNSINTDLPDGGSEHFAQTVREIKKRSELLYMYIKLIVIE